MHSLKCDSCGSTEFRIVDGHCFCEHCGTTQIFDSSDFALLGDAQLQGISNTQPSPEHKKSALKNKEYWVGSECLNYSEALGLIDYLSLSLFWDTDDDEYEDTDDDADSERYIPRYDENDKNELLLLTNHEIDEDTYLACIELGPFTLETWPDNSEFEREIANQKAAREKREIDAKAEAAVDSYNFNVGCGLVLGFIALILLCVGIYFSVDLINGKKFGELTPVETEEFTEVLSTVEAQLCACGITDYNLESLRGYIFSYNLGSIGLSQKFSSSSVASAKSLAKEKKSWELGTKWTFYLDTASGRPLEIYTGGTHIFSIMRADIGKHYYYQAIKHYTDWDNSENSYYYYSVNIYSYETEEILYPHSVHMSSDPLKVQE